MQHTQVSQHKNALRDRRVRYPLRHPVVLKNSDSAAPLSPFRPRALRVKHAVRVNPLRFTEVRQQDHLEDGLSALCVAQDEAARRIALRLHDESAQMLATVYLGLANIARDCPDSTARKIERVVGQLDEVREQLRGLSHELSPPLLDQFGLMPALQSLASGVSERSGLKIALSGETNDIPRLVGAALYRVVQEALSNVVRHARATEAVVRLSIEDQKVFCTVKDDGIGFQTLPQHQTAVVGTINGPVNGGLGLAGIYERVTALKGSCRIASCRNGGMELKVEIPL